MQIKYIIVGLVIIPLVIIAVMNWDTIFVRAQAVFYTVYYSGHTQSRKSRIEIKIFTSKLLRNSTREVRIYIPKAYDINSSARFPTLYLLHGYPGSNGDWLINANLQTKLDTLIQDHTIAPMIVIFPDGNGSIVHDSQYVDALKVKQPMESHFIKELVPFIDSHYRTQKNREKRAIGGISSGGYGAVNIGLRNNGVFGFIFSHSGYFINRERVSTQLLGTNRKIIAENNPLDYMKNKVINPKTYIYFDIGKADSSIFLKDNTNFDMLLKQRKIPSTFKLTNGWHNWRVWANYISFSLQEYSLYLKKYN